MRDQFERDKPLVNLVKTIEGVCSFVDIVRSLPNKLHLLEDVIDKILKQTVECTVFIGEYTGHGFGGDRSANT
jgi:hypothetical protein